MIGKTCRECGRAFHISRRRAEKGRGVYCSRACAGHGKAKQREGKKQHARPDCRKNGRGESTEHARHIRHTGNVLQQDFSLDYCPWQEGIVGPVHYDSDYHASPDIGWGY